MSLQIEALQRPERDLAKKHDFNWITAGVMAAFHAGAIAALFFFTWKAFIAAAVGGFSDRPTLGMILANHQRCERHALLVAPLSWGAFGASPCPDGVSPPASRSVTRRVPCGP